MPCRFRNLAYRGPIP